MGTCSVCAAVQQAAMLLRVGRGVFAVLTFLLRERTS